MLRAFFDALYFFLILESRSHSNRKIVNIKGIVVVLKKHTSWLIVKTLIQGSSLLQLQLRVFETSISISFVQQINTEVDKHRNSECCHDSRWVADFSEVHVHSYGCSKVLKRDLTITACLCCTILILFSLRENNVKSRISIYLAYSMTTTISQYNFRENRA